MKNLLKSTLGRALLNETELNTILTEIEAVINARPITQMSEDPSELKVITPSMFLQDETVTETPDLDAVDENSLTNRIRYVNEVRTHLKERFKKEYLGNLLLRKCKQTNNIRVGDVVFVASDLKKRIDWNLARVIEVYPGKDGVVRVVKLKTETSEILRPVQKVCLLEIERSNNSYCNVKSNYDHIDHDFDNPFVEENISSEIEPTVSKHEETVTRSGRVVKRRDVLDL